MSDLLDQALEIVRALPPGDQDEIPRAMLALADLCQEPETIEPDDLPHVLEGLAQARRGERATREQVDAAYRRFVR